MNEWRTALGSGEPALTEGAVWERVGGDPMPMLENSEDEARLASIYREYAAVGERWSLPVVLFAPTWRANRDHAEPGANQRAVDFMRRFAQPCGALMGPRGDCYAPEAALSREQARDFHRWQAKELAAADFVLVATLPSLSEALGIADVLSVPYLVSFVITARGELLDGTPLREAIGTIDDSVPRPPLGYWLNCVHPRVALEGLSAAGIDAARDRLVGVQGNTSRIDPRLFSTAGDFASDDAAGFAQGMLELRRRFSIPVLGGCCGTRAEHLEELARLLV